MTEILFAPIAKINDERREVYGYATTPVRDHSGEIITREAVANALPGYLQYPCVREMHNLSAVGRGIEAKLDQKGLWFGAKVVDDRAWLKVKEGVYRGFSIGGRITERDDHDKTVIKGIDLQEVSLVDRPCCPQATFELMKRADGGALQFTAGADRPRPLARIEADILAKSAAAIAGLTAAVHQRRKKGKLMTTGIDSLLAEANAAISDLSKAVNAAEIEGVVPRPNRGGKAARAHSRAVEHDAQAIARIADSVQGHMRAAAAHADGKNDEAKHAETEARAAWSAAQHHHAASASLHEFVQHALSGTIERAKAKSAHGANEDSVITPAGESSGQVGPGGSSEFNGRMKKRAEAKLAKAARQTKKAVKLMKAAREYHGGYAQQLHDHAASFEKMAKEGGAQDGDSDEGGESAKEEKTIPAEMAKALNEIAAKREEMCKAYDEGLQLSSLMTDRAGKPLHHPTDEFESNKRAPADADDTAAKRATKEEKKLAKKKDKAAKKAAKEAKKAAAAIAEEEKTPKFGKAGDAPGEGNLPYGHTTYADPGYQKDGKKRYPIDTEAHIRAAWNYVHKPKNARKYSPEHLSSIKSKIVSAWKSKIDKAGPPEAGQKTNKVAKAAATGTPAKRPFLSKGLGVIQEFAHLLDCIRRMERDYCFEQVAEHDADNKTVAEVGRWLSDGGRLLQAIVAEEIAEIARDGDVEAVVTSSETVSLGKAEPAAWLKAAARAVKAAAPLPGPERKALAGNLKQLAKAAVAAAPPSPEQIEQKVQAEVDAKVSALTKTIKKDLAEAARVKLEKRVAKKVKAAKKKLAKATAGHPDYQPDTSASATAKPDPNGSGSGKNPDGQGASDHNEAAAKVDAAMKALKDFTRQLAPLVQSAQATRQELVKTKGELAEVRERLAQIENQPLPPLRLGKGSKIQPVTKEMDGGGNSPALGQKITWDNVEQIPRGKQRAQAILQLAANGK